MVKHTQTIRRQIPHELFECVSPSCEIGAKRINTSPKTELKSYMRKIDLTNFLDWMPFYHLTSWKKSAIIQKASVQNT